MTHELALGGKPLLDGHFEEIYIDRGGYNRAVEGLFVDRINNSELALDTPEVVALWTFLRHVLIRDPQQRNMTVRSLLETGTADTIGYRLKETESESHVFFADDVGFYAKTMTKMTIDEMEDEKSRLYRGRLPRAPPRGKDYVDPFEGFEVQYMPMNNTSK